MFSEHVFLRTPVYGCFCTSEYDILLVETESESGEILKVPFWGFITKCDEIIFYQNQNLEKMRDYRGKLFWLRSLFCK